MHTNAIIISSCWINQRCRSILHERHASVYIIQWILNSPGTSGTKKPVLYGIRGFPHFRSFQYTQTLASFPGLPHLLLEQKTGEVWERGYTNIWITFRTKQSAHNIVDGRFSGVSVEWGSTVYYKDFCATLFAPMPRCLHAQTCTHIHSTHTHTHTHKHKQVIRLND